MLYCDWCYQFFDAHPPCLAFDGCIRLILSLSFQAMPAAVIVSQTKRGLSTVTAACIAGMKSWIWVVQHVCCHMDEVTVAAAEPRNSLGVHGSAHTVWAVLLRVQCQHCGCDLPLLVDAFMPCRVAVPHLCQEGQPARHKCG